MWHSKWHLNVVAVVLFFRPKVAQMFTFVDNTSLSPLVCTFIHQQLNGPESEFGLFLRVPLRAINDNWRRFSIVENGHFICILVTLTPYFPTHLLAVSTTEEWKSSRRCVLRFLERQRIARWAKCLIDRASAILIPWRALWTSSEGHCVCVWVCACACPCVCVCLCLYACVCICECLYCVDYFSLCAYVFEFVYVYACKCNIC